VTLDEKNIEIVNVAQRTWHKGPGTKDLAQKDLAQKDLAQKDLAHTYDDSLAHDFPLCQVLCARPFVPRPFVPPKALFFFFFWVSVLFFFFEIFFLKK
jgi:hypothetical protein